MPLSYFAAILFSDLVQMPNEAVDKNITEAISDDDDQEDKEMSYSYLTFPTTTLYP